MKTLIRYSLLALMIISSGYIAKTQDIHYSQMYNTPLYINPAFTGNHECDFRAAANYRQQAASFTTPFTTYTAWGDTRFYPGFTNRRGWFGVGAHLYYDNAGDGDLTKVQGTLLSAYSQGFNSDNSLYGSLGVGLSYTNRTVNQAKFIFGDNWDPNDLEWDPINYPTAESLPSSSIFYLDFNVGLSVHHMVNSNWMYEVGGSMSHVNKPKESFYGENNRLGRKFIAHATVQHIASENFLIKPEIYFIAHEGVTETLLGSNIVYGALDLKLHGGLWYRLGRDLIPVLGIEYNKFALLFSYDINVSKQRVASNYQGGFEFSLVKKFCGTRGSKRDPCKFLEF